MMAAVAPTHSPCIHQCLLVTQSAFAEAGCLDKSAVREEQDVHQKIPGFSGAAAARHRSCCRVLP